MHKGLTLSILFSIFITGCAKLIEVENAINRPNIESYDLGVCEHGAPANPGQPVRAGCVNNKTQEENTEAYLNYKEAREKYLNE